MKEREKFGSRLGFILVSAGCAIGIGNVWKFPYIAGQGGGGAFVLFYLIFLVILGLPIMTMEFAVGRASRKSPVRAYQALEKPGQKWHIHGYFTLIGCYLLMMFYTTVAGWMLHYFYMTAAGKLAGLNAEQVAGKFTEMLASPATMTFWMVFVVVVGILVCAKGLQSGLERVTKGMMIALLLIMVVLAVNSLFMPGAKEGLTFFLVPDFARMQEVGVVNTLVSAMNQAFFTLSLGIGAMSIFGSYIGKEHSLLGESVRIVVLDTFVAITAGLIIFPACFTYHVDQTSGPSLIFITLPNIFANMSMGRLWGSLFFLFMAFAAMSTVLATVLAASYTGHSAWQHILPVWAAKPSISHSSSVMWGAKGFSIRIRGFMSPRVTPLALISLTMVIMAAMAVFIFRLSISSVTFLMVL